MSEVHLCRQRVDPGGYLATCDHFEPQSMRITLSVVDRCWHKRVKTVLKWYKPGLGLGIRGLGFMVQGLRAWGRKFRVES